MINKEQLNQALANAVLLVAGLFAIATLAALTWGFVLACVGVSQ